VDPRTRRLAIREHLNAARAAVDRGDRRAALAAINAALLLDPDYLAAQTLKERVERSADLRAEFNGGSAAAGLSGPPGTSASAAALPSNDPSRSPAGMTSQPVVSPEGWARFESRARARRIEKRVAAAQAAIARGRFAAAQSIVDEIREMDPAHPDLISLAIEIDAAAHSRPTWAWRIGPATAAIVVFGALLFGAQYLEMAPADRTVSVDPGAGSGVALPAPTSAAPADPEPRADARASDSLASAGPAASGPAPLAADRDFETTEPAPTSTSLVARRPASASSASISSPSTPSPSTPSPSTPSPSTPSPSTLSPSTLSPSRPSPAASSASVSTRGTFSSAASSSTDAGALANLDPPTTRAGDSNRPTEPSLSAARTAAAPSPAVVETPHPPAAAPVIDIERADPAVERAVLPDTLSTVAAPPALVAAAATVPVVRDEDLVRETLQVYRRAYESLDAQSARAVWPRVDGAALQRAFDGLESQRLMFDSCQVQVRGSSGSAICRGTTRYVPKVGSRDPRVEPRTWTFALHKSGDDWQIDSARAER
jgi:hypothetical protein